MAKLGRPKSYYPFRNFNKTYKRYKKVYFQTAKRKFKRALKKMSDREKQNLVDRGVNLSRPTQKVLQTYMEDNLESKADFREDYRNYKRDLQDEGSTSDPIQYMVADQAYKYSAKQYRGFKKAVKESRFQEITGLDLSEVKREEFMEGNWESDRFFGALDIYYWKMKEEAKSLYADEKSQVRYARNKVAELAFGRNEEAAFWADSK